MQPSSSSFRFRPLFGSSEEEEEEVEELKPGNMLTTYWADWADEILGTVFADAKVAAV